MKLFVCSCDSITMLISLSYNMGTPPIPYWIFPFLIYLSSYGQSYNIAQPIYFTYRGEFYEQVDRVAMGLPLSSLTSL